MFRAFAILFVTMFIANWAFDFFSNYFLKYLSVATTFFWTPTPCVSPQLMPTSHWDRIHIFKDFRSSIAFLLFRVSSWLLLPVPLLHYGPIFLKTLCRCLRLGLTIHIPGWPGTLHKSGWPRTPRGSPGSACWVLGLKAMLSFSQIPEQICNLYMQHGEVLSQAN